MTVTERIEDISAKSGMSTEVVRRVLSASRDSLISTLKKGEKSTLPGIATYSIKNKSDGVSVGVRSKVSLKILNALEDGIKPYVEESTEYIDMLQIPGLM